MSPRIQHNNIQGSRIKQLKVNNNSNKAEDNGGEMKDKQELIIPWRQNSASNNDSAGIQLHTNLKLKLPNAPKPSPAEKPNYFKQDSKPVIKLNDC